MRLLRDAKTHTVFTIFIIVTKIYQGWEKINFGCFF